MATIREGNQTVLLVVDAQVGVLSNSWESPRIIRNIQYAVDQARRQGIPVIWVQHSDDEMEAGSPDWQIVPELVPAAGWDRDLRPGD